MIRVDQLIEQARDWVGVKFLHQGRTRMGCDCMGFVAGVLKELNCDVLDEVLPRNLSRDPKAQMIDSLSTYTRRIDLQPGALVVFKLPGVNFATHAGIFTGTSLLQSNEFVRKVVEHGYQEPWLKWTDSAWALPLVMYV